MKNDFATYYANHGAVMTGGSYFNQHSIMAGGGEADVTPKYKMRDKVKLRAPYDYQDKDGNTVTITTEDVGVIRYRDDDGKEQEFSEWMEDIKEQNKIHGHVGYFVKFPKILSYIWMEESSIIPASGREVLYRKIINLIKYQIEVEIQNIPTIRDRDTLEEVHNVPYIHIFGKKWSGYFRNYSGSATIEKIEEKFPKNKTLLKLANIYRDYNMNDFYAGTKAQDDAVKKWILSGGDKFDYDKKVEYLKSIGLYEDKGYKYGTEWLYKPVPASVVTELKELSEQLSDEYKGWAGGGAVNNDDFASSEKSSIFVPSKPTKDEISNIISGARSVTNGTAIQTASNFLRRSESASPLDRSQHFSERQDGKRLREYISENNLWIPLPNPTDKIGGGGEAQVYLSGDHVIKLNYARFYDSWQDYFNSLLLHNYFFPITSYELIGFSEDDKNVLYAVVKQPFIKATSITRLMEIRKVMSDLGFIYSGGKHYRSPTLDIELKDLHEGNVLTKDDVLYFIDTIFYLKK